MQQQESTVKERIYSKDVKGRKELKQWPADYDLRILRVSMVKVEQNGADGKSFIAILILPNILSLPAS